MFQRYLLATLIVCGLLQPSRAASASDPTADRVPCALGASLPFAVANAPMVIFGELHGTNEAPNLIGEVACALGKLRPGVTVALEVPDTEQSRISSYLGSTGTAADRQSLLAGEFWNRPRTRQDGRYSQAMVRLIERIRQLRSAGLPVDVLAMDGARPGVERDALMAESVRQAIELNSATAVIVLTGNVHAIKRKGVVVSQTYRPLAYHLAADGALSLEVIHKGGTAWACIDGCSIKKVQEHPLARDRAPGIHLGVSTNHWYDGCVVVPESTASPPANDA